MPGAKLDQQDKTFNPWLQSFALRNVSALAENIPQTVGSGDGVLSPWQQRRPTVTSAPLQRASKRALEGSCGTLKISPRTVEVFAVGDLAESQGAEESKGDAPAQRAVEQVERLKRLLQHDNRDLEDVFETSTPFSLLPFIRFGVDNKLVYRSKVCSVNSTTEEAPQLLQLQPKHLLHQRGNKQKSQHDDNTKEGEANNKIHHPGNLHLLAVGSWNETLVCFVHNPFSVLSLQLCDLDPSLESSGGAIWEVIATHNREPVAALRNGISYHLILNGQVLLPPIYGPAATGAVTVSQLEGVPRQSGDFNLQHPTSAFVSCRVDLTFESNGWWPELDALSRLPLLNWGQNMGKRGEGGKIPPNLLWTDEEVLPAAVAIRAAKGESRSEDAEEEAAAQRFTTKEMDIQGMVQDVLDLKREILPPVMWACLKFQRVLNWENSLASCLFLIVFTLVCFRPVLLLTVLCWGMAGIFFVTLMKRRRMSRLGLPYGRRRLLSGLGGTAVEESAAAVQTKEGGSKGGKGVGAVEKNVGGKEEGEEEPDTFDLGGGFVKGESVRFLVTSGMSEETKQLFGKAHQFVHWCLATARFLAGVVMWEEGRVFLSWPISLSLVVTGFVVLLAPRLAATFVLQAFVLSALIFLFSTFSPVVKGLKYANAVRLMGNLVCYRIIARRCSRLVRAAK